MVNNVVNIFVADLDEWQGEVGDIKTDWTSMTFVVGTIRRLYGDMF